VANGGTIQAPNIGKDKDHDKPQLELNWESAGQGSNVADALSHIILPKKCPRKCELLSEADPMNTPQNVTQKEKQTKITKATILSIAEEEKPVGIRQPDIWYVGD
jgi:hypothetical protein